jgi:hypothetical protein
VYLRKVKFVNPVMELQFEPQGGSEAWEFKEGMYLFLNCPRIHAREYHPFTISSAYGDLVHDDYVSVSLCTTTTFSLSTFSIVDVILLFRGIMTGLFTYFVPMIFFISIYIYPPTLCSYVHFIKTFFLRYTSNAMPVVGPKSLRTCWRK